jgi:hypothetical protein
MKFETFIVLIGGIGGSLGAITIYNTLENTDDDTRLWDPFLIIILIFCAFEFSKVYKIAPELRKRVSFLLFGFILAVLGLIINWTILMVTNNGTIIRAMIPAIG